jgi:hypothetical protein
MPLLPPEDEHQQRVNSAWLSHVAKDLRSELKDDGIPDTTPDEDVVRYYRDTYASDANPDQFDSFLKDTYSKDFKAPSETLPEKTAGVIRGVGRAVPSMVRQAGQQITTEAGARALLKQGVKGTVRSVGAPLMGGAYLARMAGQLYTGQELGQIADAMPAPDITALQQHYFKALEPGLTAKGYTPDQVVAEVQKRVGNVVRGYTSTQNSLMSDVERTSDDVLESGAEGIANVSLLGVGGGLFKNALKNGARRALGGQAAKVAASTIAGRLVSHAVTGATLGGAYGAITGAVESGARAAEAGKSVPAAAVGGTISGGLSGAAGGAIIGGPLGAGLEALGQKAVVDAAARTPKAPEPLLEMAVGNAIPKETNITGVAPTTQAPPVGSQAWWDEFHGVEKPKSPIAGVPAPAERMPTEVAPEIAPRLPAPESGPLLEGPPRGRVEPLELSRPLALPEADAGLSAARAAGEPHSISLPTESVEKMAKSIQYLKDIEGAKVSVRPSVDGQRLVIDNIKGAEHGSGASGKALDRIMATADASKVPLDVTVADYKGPRGGVIPAEKVASWYERRGFQRVNETAGSITLHRPITDPNPPLTSEQLGALAEHHVLGPEGIAKSEEAAQLEAFMKRAQGLSEPRAAEALGNIEEGKPMIRGQGTSGQPSVGMRLGNWLDQQAAAADTRITTKLGRMSTGFDPTLIGDYAIKAAAKMYRLGYTAYKSLSAELLKDHPGIPSPTMKDIISQAREIIQTRLQGDNVTVTKLSRLLDAAEEGRPGANWYDETSGAVNKMFGGDGDMFLRFLAATSAGKAADANVTMALKAYGQWKLGLPFDGFMGNDQRMLEQASRGEVFGERKLQSILAALRGDPNAVAIDRHVMRALGFEKAGAEKGSLTDREYDFFEAVLRDLAHSRGMTPRQFQAALWTSAKIRQAQSATTPREMAHLHSFRPYEGILKYEHDMAEGGKTPVEWVNEHRVTLQHLANASEGVTKTRAGEGFTYSPYDYSAYKGNHGIVTTLASVKIPTNKLSAAEIIGFTQKFKKLLASYYGMNTDTFNLAQAGEDGMTSMDLNVVLPESMRDRAIELGKSRQQRSLWDLNKGETIDTGYTGTTSDAPKDPKERGQWWRKQVDEIDQLMQKIGIPSRSIRQVDMFQPPIDRITSGDQYWGLEAEQVMPKDVHEKLEAAKTAEEITNIIADNERPIAAALHGPGLTQDYEVLKSDGSATDLLRYYLRKKNIPHEVVLGKTNEGRDRVWVRTKEGAELDPSGEGMKDGVVVKDTAEPELKRGQIEAMLRTPHRWHAYAADALNVPEEQVKKLVDEGKLHPISDAGMLDHVMVNKDGAVWEYVDPTPPSYNIMKLVGMLRGKRAAETLAYLDGKHILSGHDVVQEYRSQAGFARLVDPTPKVVSFARRAPVAKINNAIVQADGTPVKAEDFRYGNHSGTSLWLSPDGKVFRVPFHLRNADIVIKKLRLKNPVQYEGMEHDALQLMLNHGYARVQLHEQSYATDSTVPLTSGQVQVLRQLSRGPEGKRSFAGRLTNPNGEPKDMIDDYSMGSGALNKYSAESRGD